MPTDTPADVLWEGRARSAWALPTSLLFVALALVIALTGPWPVALVVLAGGLAILALVAVTVQVTGDELRIRYGGPLGFPTQRLALDRVARVEAIEVRPLRYGGWGYRGSLRLFRRAAVVLRRGPGLRLALTDGRELVVTVDGAAGALAAVPARLVTR